MTVSEFTSKLRERYETINKSNLDDISALVKTISDEDRDGLWSAFVDSYEFNTPPKRATFRKLMYKTGVREKEQKTYYAFCKSCKTGYPTDITTCYYCGERLSMHVGELPVRYVELHRYCVSCEKFAPGIQGAICKYYGYGSHQWKLPDEETKKQIEICKVCLCRKCCYEERVYLHAYFDYQDMFARGEFRGPTGFERKK